MKQVHAERVSLPAQRLLKLLKSVEPMDQSSQQAKARLLGWSGQMDADRVEPTIYSRWRDTLLTEILQHNLGAKLTAQALNPSDRGQGLFLARIKGRILDHWEAGNLDLLPSGQTWESLAADTLATAVAFLNSELGNDMDQWRWDHVHQSRPRHTLSAAYPELAEILNPPPIAMAGDSDTPLAGSYSPANFATVSGLSVVRYAFDLSDWSKSLWAVPLGSSGHPGSPHYHDQSKTWRQVEMTPMLYDWREIAVNCETQQILLPV